MAASTVNIADFRCRDLKARMGRATARTTENRDKLGVVESAGIEEHEAEPFAENPAVLDIGALRDNTRMRRRLVLHTMPASRHRSNLVRFNEPQVAVMRINRPRAMESWAKDDFDDPPAA
jgi:hypothetical protein